jgi:hypothetical protein
MVFFYIDCQLIEYKQGVAVLDLKTAITNTMMGILLRCVDGI